jgi:hypothetical protein
VAWQNRYRVELWTVDGRLELTIDRQAAWFPPRSEDPKVYASPIAAGPVQKSGEPPVRLAVPTRLPDIPPFVTRVVEDDAGLLWIALTGASAGRAIRRLEVVDPRENRLIRSDTLPVAMTGMWTGGYALSRSESADGYVSIHVWRIALKQPPLQTDGRKE